MNEGIPGYRWMVSPDGFKADLVHENDIRTRCPDWTDCTEMPDAEVMQLMERRMLASKRNEKLPVAV